MVILYDHMGSSWCRLCWDVWEWNLEDVLSDIVDTASEMPAGICSRWHPPEPWAGTPVTSHLMYLVCACIYAPTSAHAQAPGNHGGHFPPIVDLTIDLWNPAHFTSFQIGSGLPINAKSHSVEGWQGTMDTLLSVIKRKLWLQRTGPQEWGLRFYCSDRTGSAWQVLSPQTFFLWWNVLFGIFPLLPHSQVSYLKDDEQWEINITALPSYVA